jgi:hypothetical protein
MIYSLFFQSIPVFIIKKDIYLCKPKMVDVAQSVRALDCGSRCRGFESHLPPHSQKPGFFETPVFLIR